LKRLFSNSRVLVPLIHTGIALALLSSLYLPGWRKWRIQDVSEQQGIEADARAGRWPPSDNVKFELCYFGSPRQISAMFPANLPAILIAGALVTPSNARDHLLERAPGRILPSTWLLLFIAIFAAVVAVQWYLLVRVTSAPQTPPHWRRIVYIVAIASIPLGLILHEKWADLFRFASLPFWMFIATGTVLQYCKKRDVASRA